MSQGPSEETTEVIASGVRRWAVKPVGEDITALAFEIGSGTSAYALKNAEAAGLLGGLFAHLSSIASPHDVASRTQGLRIAADALEIERGQKENDAFVSVRAGSLTLTFALDRGVMLEALKRYLDRVPV